MNSGGEVIPWRFDVPPSGLHVGPDVATMRNGIGNALALLRAVEAGELLAALPECAVARAQHMTALTLLRLAEDELQAVHEIVKD